MKIVDLNAQYLSIKKEISEAIQRVLDRGDFILGKEVSELESALAEYVGVSHCVTCANGTDALTLSLMSLGIGPGDLVFTTAFSFVATAEPIKLVGAIPIFVDINKDTLNICVQHLEMQIVKALGMGWGDPKAIIAVDLFGLPANYEALSSLSAKYGLKLIADGAQSFGASYCGRKVGALADVSTTSFFPAKPLGCYGDGGAVFTNSSTLAELIRSIRVHGKGVDKYDNVRLGFNSRLDTIQAAILLEKLKIFDWEIERRNQIAEIFRSEIDVYRHQSIPSGARSVYAQYSLQVIHVDRESVLAYLQGTGIPSAIYYPKILPKMLPFNNTPDGDWKISGEVSKNIFCVPINPYLSELEINKIIVSLRKSLES